LFSTSCRYSSTGSGRPHLFSLLLSSCDPTSPADQSMQTGSLTARSLWRSLSSIRLKGVLTPAGFGRDPREAEKRLPPSASTALRSLSRCWNVRGYGFDLHTRVARLSCLNSGPSGLRCLQNDLSQLLCSLPTKPIFLG